MVEPHATDYLQAGDGRLIAWFCGGDARALETLLERYEAPLFQFLLGLLRDRHQAEDALQETWCRALEHLDGVDVHHLRGWLFTVAYHQAMLIRRKQKPTVPLEAQAPVVDPAPGPLAQAAQREQWLRLGELIDRLPPRQREVLRQRVFEGKRFRDIAADLECPLNTALARMHEGVKRLRLLWGSDHA